MPYNGSGTFTPPASSFPEVPDTLIDAIRYDATITDISGGLSNAICRDGQTTLTAHLPFNGFKGTNMAAGTARTDSATITNLQDGTGIYVSVVSGTVDAITLGPSPAIATYTAGQTFRFSASGANTGAVTLAVSGLAAKDVTKNGTTALVAGDISSGMMVTITYDGTRFVLAATSTATLNSPTITSPTIVTPTLSGSVIGTYTLAGTPSITSAVLTTSTVAAPPTTDLGVVEPDTKLERRLREYRDRFQRTVPRQGTHGGLCRHENTLGEYERRRIHSDRLRGVLYGYHET
jgi:hypothetical protein